MREVVHFRGLILFLRTGSSIYFRLSIYAPYFSFEFEPLRRIFSPTLSLDNDEDWQLVVVTLND